MMYYASIWYDFDIAVTDYTQLYPALKILQPTILIAPPILYQLTHTRFAAALKDWKRRLAARLISWVPDLGLRQRLARPLFKDVHGMFGGRMRLLISGMAPLNRNTIDFFDAHAASAQRILWDGGGGFSHLPAAILAEIWFGGQAAARRDHVLRGGWRNHHSSREIPHPEIFPMRAGGEREHLHRRQPAGHGRYREIRCRGLSQSAWPRKRN